jgi:CDP-6-deoxy-D-xylo-4-hexulose-3-dehydrase
MRSKSLAEFLKKCAHEITPFLASQSRSPNTVPLADMSFGVEEVIEILDSLLTRNVTMGAKTAKFEKNFSEYVGVKHAIMVNSGSSANLLMFAALANPLREAGLRLAPGDEVLVPAVTWATTVWPITTSGCIPVLVDVDLRTLNMCVEATRSAITPKTKAVFVTHVLGNPADMDAFRNLTSEFDLILLEDACQALGSTYKGQHVGGFSMAASFSFFFSHHITTIEGGMIVTDDDELADLFRSLRAHGWIRNMEARKELAQAHPEIDEEFLFVNTGFNVRPTEVQAAFGLQQLPKLERFSVRRREITWHFCQALGGLDGLQIIKPTEGADHAWFGFPVLLSTDRANERRSFLDHLKVAGIETRPILAGNIARQPAMRHVNHRIDQSLKNAQAVMDRGLYWSCYPGLTDMQIEHTIRTVTEYFKG